VTARALGRRPPKNAPALRLGTYLTGVVPPHPAATDHLSEVSDWGLWDNDQVGDCGPVSVANSRKLITRYLTDLEAQPTQTDVFDLYRRSGNPGFDPNDPGGHGDQGVDMQTMLEAAASGGFAGVKPLGFAKVDPSSLEQVRAAIAVFGSVLLGVNLEVAQQTQTGHGFWDYQQSGEWGGHAVVAGRYSPASPPAQVGLVLDEVGVVTWARVVDVSDAFLTHQLEEAWVVIWPEHLGSRTFLEGVDLAALAADYRALTGRPFPGAVPPSPQPVPPGPAPQPVVTADEALAAAAGPWLTLHHTGTNRRMADALRAWIDAKGL
jgi:hypothetical protein